MSGQTTYILLASLCIGCVSGKTGKGHTIQATPAATRSAVSTPPTVKAQPKHEQQLAEDDCNTYYSEEFDILPDTIVDEYDYPNPYANFVDLCALSPEELPSFDDVSCRSYATKLTDNRGRDINCKFEDNRYECSNIALTELHNHRGDWEEGKIVRVYPSKAAFISESTVIGRNHIRGSHRIHHRFD